MNANDEEAGVAPANRPPRTRSSIPSFLFISFLLFMLTSHNGDEFLARHQYQDALQSLEYQLSNFTSWMTGKESNFTLPELDLSIPPLLDVFDIRELELDPTRESYYSNITGFIHGDLEFTNVSIPSLIHNDILTWRPLAERFSAGVNASTLDERLGTWSWNTSNKVSLSLVEKMPAGRAPEQEATSTPIALIHGRIELIDQGATENLRLEFEGVHFIAKGSVYGFAEPPGRHIDIRELPSLVPENMRNETAKVIEPELQARIDKLKNLIDAGVIDSDTSGNDDTPPTTCPFTFYAQIHPVAVPEHLMQELEDELQTPTGIRTVSTPKLSINAALMSKECGIVYQLTETEGLRSRTFFRKVTTYAGLTALAYLTLLILFSRQSERSRTPSGISKVSRWTFLSQATMDSVSFAGHVTFAILAEGRPSLSLIAPAFLACIVFTYEAQFAALIHQIQGPESYTPPAPAPPPPRTPAQAAAQAASARSSSTTEPLLPLTSPLPQIPEARPQPPPQPQGLQPQPPRTLVEAANNSPPTTFFAFFIHHVRTDPQARMWLTLVIFLTLIVRVILSPLLSMIFVAVSYSTIWLPQIVRSVRRGRSSGLSNEYVVGTTICRLFSVLYFLGCPKNVLEIETRPWVWLLSIFVCLQACVVMLQNVFGPAFFLPRQYSEVNSYNYHPPIPLPDPEAPEQSLGDCAICMDAILVDPSLRESSQSSEQDDEKRRLMGGMFDLGASTSARKNYSLAPCSHLFHTECLEKWLAIKNICPHCRRPLPPL